MANKTCLIPTLNISSRRVVKSWDKRDCLRTKAKSQFQQVPRRSDFGLFECSPRALGWKLKTKIMSYAFGSIRNHIVLGTYITAMPLILHLLSRSSSRSSRSTVEQSILTNCSINVSQRVRDFRLMWHLCRNYLPNKNSSYLLLSHIFIQRAPCDYHLPTVGRLPNIPMTLNCLLL